MEGTKGAEVEQTHHLPLGFPKEMLKDDERRQALVPWSLGILVLSCTQFVVTLKQPPWIPACAGMTGDSVRPSFTTRRGVDV